jgi:hypothetical protein
VHSVSATSCQSSDAILHRRVLLAAFFQMLSAFPPSSVNVSLVPLVPEHGICR